MIHPDECSNHPKAAVGHHDFDSDAPQVPDSVYKARRFS